MADETGKTVKATLEVLLNTGTAKRQAKDLAKEFAQIEKAAVLNDWRSRNAVERRKDQVEEQKQRKQSHAEEMAHQRSLGLMVRSRKKEEHDLELAKMRSLSLMVRTRRKEMHEEAQEAKRMEREASRQNTARGSLALQSLSLMGAGGFAGRVGKMQAYGQLMQSAGMPRIGGGMIKGAIPIQMAMSSINALADAGDVNRHIFADEEQKRAMLLQKWDGLGVYDKINSLRGLPKKAALANFDVQKDAIRRNADLEQFGFKFDYAGTSQGHLARSEAFAGYGAPVGLPTADRGTSAIARREFQEQLRLQQSTQNLAKTERELLTARKASAMAADRSAWAERRYATELADAGYKGNVSEELKAGFFHSGDAITAKLRAAGVSENQINVLEGYRNIYMKSLHEKQGAEAGVVGAEYQNRVGYAQQQRDILGIAEARSAQAEDRARSIGGMGQSGRLKGKLALQMLVQNGIQFATPDMIAAAKSIDPEGVGMMEEQLGKSDIAENRGWYKKYAPHVAQYELDDARAAESAQRAKVAGIEPAAEEKRAAAMADVYAASFVDLFMAAMETKVKTEINKIVAASEKAGAKAVVGGPTQ